MNLRSPGVWIGIFSLVAVLGVAVVDMRRNSPGTLATVHGRIPELVGRSSCAQCHGGLLGGMAQACLDCHEAIDAQIAAGQGVHGAVGRERARQCALCHSEHHGPTFDLVNRASFAQIGASSAQEFDHAFIGWEMNGAHLEQDCAACHEFAEIDVLPEGAARFVGLDKNCATCHEDPHAGTLGRDCAQCHGQESVDDLHFGGHEEWLPLVGGHAAANCRDCHAQDSARSLEALALGAAPKSRRGCIACHESPHSEGFTTRVAKSTGRDPARGCVACHETEHDSFVDEEMQVTPQLHAQSGFRLVEPHEDVICAQCHDPALDDVAARYPGRRPNACVECHDDPHDGQFGSGPFAAAGCIACHAKTHFDPHTFDLDKHGRTAMPLTGAHAETACEACHRAPAPGAARRFHATNFRCEACHADAHEEFFRGFAAELAAEEMGDCAACHGTDAFDDVPEESFDHAKWTGFPLRGAHAQSACAICHEASAEPNEVGRTFGTVDRIFGTFERGDGCSVCHVDPHRGSFDVGKRPAVFEGRTGCARCHDETSFRALPYGFHHVRWTGFALRAAHQKLACSQCHAPMRPADELGRTWSPAPGTGCADCHADPHAGQFRVEGVTDCSRCHDDGASSFSELTFDHDTDSRFALHEAHADLDCSACHFPVDVGDAQIVRFRPLSRECVDCHGEHEDVMLRRQKEMRRRRR